MHSEFVGGLAEEAAQAPQRFVLVQLTHTKPRLVIVVHIPFMEVAQAECGLVVFYVVETAPLPVVGFQAMATS